MILNIEINNNNSTQVYNIIIYGLIQKNRLDILHFKYLLCDFTHVFKFWAKQEMYWF